LEFGVLVYVEEGKLENPEKNPRSKARTNNELDPHMDMGQHRAWVILVEGEQAHLCTILAPQNKITLREHLQTIF